MPAPTRALVHVRLRSNAVAVDPWHLLGQAREAPQNRRRARRRPNSMPRRIDAIPLRRDPGTNRCAFEACGAESFAEERRGSLARRAQRAQWVRYGSGRPEAMELENAPPSCRRTTFDSRAPPSFETL